MFWWALPAPEAPTLGGPECCRQWEAMSVWETDMLAGGKRQMGAGRGPPWEDHNQQRTHGGDPGHTWNSRRVLPARHLPWVLDQLAEPLSP